MSELSYEEIVHHIVSDKPIPNVVPVPDITLSKSSRTISEMQPRRKPWELKEELVNAPTDGSGKLDNSDLNIEESGFDIEEPAFDFKGVINQPNSDPITSYYTREFEFDAAINNSTNDDKT